MGNRYVCIVHNSLVVLVGKSTSKENSTSFLNSTPFSWNVSFLDEILPLPFKYKNSHMLSNHSILTWKYLLDSSFVVPQWHPPSYGHWVVRQRGEQSVAEDEGLSLRRLWDWEGSGARTAVPIASHPWRTVRHWYLVSSSTASPCTCELLVATNPTGALLHRYHGYSKQPIPTET